MGLFNPKILFINLYQPFNFIDTSIYGTPRSTYVVLFISAKVPSTHTNFEHHFWFLVRRCLSKTSRTVTLSSNSPNTKYAVGCNYPNPSSYVRVFQRDGSSWTRVGEDIYGEAADDYFGSFLSLSADGTVLSAGATGNDGNDGDKSGHVRVFELI